MKRFLFVVLCVSLFVPLYARDKEKKPFTFERQRFELGFDMGMGFANDLISVKEVFRENIVIDLDTLDENIKDEGGSLKAGVMADFFINIKNINIGSGVWDIGFYTGADGSFNSSLPKSLFTLISKGNANQPYYSGEINIVGAVFADAAIKTSAKYGKLRIGVTPSLFTPLLYIPRSGINYVLDTHTGIYMSSYGEISVYSPFVDNGELKFGFDISLQGEYALFSFLDVGAGLSRIPIVPAKLQNRMKLTAKTDEPLNISGQDLMDGKEVDFPDLDFNEEYDTFGKKVVRPMRFDAYARLKPVGGRELLVFTPNVGFTADISNKDWYFNAGLEARLNLINLFVPYVSIGREEGLWKNRFGFALNFRVFELGIEAAMQAQTFKDSFRMKGVAAALGLRFGW